MKTKAKSKTWPQRIRAILDKHGLTQAVLANEMGISPSAVCRWCKGVAVPCGTAKKILEKIESGDFAIALGNCNR